jgi:hypothetical protein
MPRVRSGAPDKWVRRAAVAGPDYQAGVSNPRTSWATAAQGASGNYTAGVQAAVSRGSYSKGVQAAGDATWSERANTLGAQRYPQGVQASQNRYATKVAPYLQTIEALSLPPKGPKGDPRNYARVQAIGDALRKRKLGGQA